MFGLISSDSYACRYADRATGKQTSQLWCAVLRRMLRCTRCRVPTCRTLLSVPGRLWSSPNLSSTLPSAWTKSLPPTVVCRLSQGVAKYRVLCLLR